MRRIVLALAAAAFVWTASGSPSAQPTRSNVVLVTLDGARVEEIFGGLDRTVFASTLPPGQAIETHALYRRFWAETAEARREKLLPFFWTLMRDAGSIAGNPVRNSHVRLGNGHRFSYPGYAELLLGVPHDDRINSNEPVRMPFPTVLEFLRESLDLQPSDVAVFASWSVFNEIAESREGALTINAGFEPFDHPDPLVQALSRLQMETATPWDTVRHDAYTFRFAMAHLAAHKPRVMYLALGETDDWAHDGRYNRVLEAYARTDAYLRELWTWLQSQPEYRGRTSLLLTSDHGRGRGVEGWRHHGVQHAGSEATWMAFVSPASDRRGEWSNHAPLVSAQAAATLIEWTGGDWRRFNPSAAPPVD